MKNNSILLIHGTAPKMGGASLKTFDLCKYFSKKNDKVILVSPYSESPLLNSKIKELNISHYNLPLNKWQYMIINIFKILKIIKNNNIKYIYSAHRNSDIISYFLKILSYNSLKIFTTIHFSIQAYNYDYAKFAKFRQFIHKYVIKKFDKIIAVSKVVNDDLENYFNIQASKIKLIYNGIDYNNCLSGNKLNLKYKKNENIIDIGYIGSISKIKNYKQLLKIIDILSQKKEVRIFILGENKVGKEKDIFFQNANSNVYYEGIQYNINDWLDFFDIQIYTSTNESFGRAVAEGQAAGIPVVAFDGGGISEIIENNNTGFLINKYNLPDFISKVDLLISNPSIRKKMKISAKARIKNKFSKKRYLEKYYSLMKKDA
jgi:glycosyltransferase involved in cell wall biosynthesis